MQKAESALQAVLCVCVCVTLGGIRVVEREYQGRTSGTAPDKPTPPWSPGYKELFYWNFPMSFLS